MPKGSYAEVIKGPARRLDGNDTARSKIEDALVDALLADIEAGGAKDALPLLAFTLERLYVEHRRRRRSDASPSIERLGGIKGSIEAAVERALKAADADPAIPRDRAARLALLRRGLIPWLAGIDPDTGAPRRRVARLSEIPAEARPLIQHLVEQRLLATDVNKDTGEATIEPAHEALLRQWGLLQGWLTEDAGLLAVLRRRQARHPRLGGEQPQPRLARAPDGSTGRRGAAVGAARPRRQPGADRSRRTSPPAGRPRPTRSAASGSCRRDLRSLLRSSSASSAGSISRHRRGVALVDGHAPYMVVAGSAHVLTAAQEQALKPGDSFKECAQDCPEMIVVPAGSFTMGSPANRAGRRHREGRSTA